MAMVLGEAPSTMAADGKSAGFVKTASTKQPSQFKKKLEDCVALENETAYGLPAVQNQSGNIDNSMVTQSTPQQAEQAIVGILEGFGLLDYQTNTPETAGAQPTHTILEQPTVQESAVSAENEAVQTTAPTVRTQTAVQDNGVFEQYARMLSNGQFSLLSQEEQQAMIQTVGEYLGSLESTNKSHQPDTGTQEAANGSGTETGELSAEDKLLTLLMKLKAIRSQQPADSVQEPETAQTAVVDSAEVSSSAAKSSERESVAPVSTQEKANEQPVKTDTAFQSVMQPDAAVSKQASQTSAMQAGQPVTQNSDVAQDNVMRIVDKMSTQSAEGRHDFDVELKPDFLGKVNIKITLENGDVRMHIRTEDAGVKGMFTDQTTAMQAALKEKGIAVSSIDVTYQPSQVMADSGQQAFKNGNGYFGKKPGTRQDLPLDLIAGSGFYGSAVAQSADYGWSGSSVEYLA